MILLFIFLSCFLIYNSCNKKIIVINDEFNIDLLYNEVNISSELLDLLIDKYKNHDEDYKKLNQLTLFDPPPDLLVPDPFRIYARIRNINQGGRLADIYYFMNYKYGSSRIQMKYMNSYIYYYYRENIVNWIFVIIISEHTGEILYYITSSHVSPIL